MDKVLQYGQSAQRGALKRKATEPPKATAIKPPAAVRVNRPRVEKPATPQGRPAPLPTADPAKPAARPAPKPAGAPAAAAPTPAKLSAEAEATMAKDLDLFGVTRAAFASACPDCRHELSNVVALGRKLRACLHCRGVWLPLGLIKTFDKDGTWLKHLGPAIQAAVQSISAQAK